MDDSYAEHKKQWQDYYDLAKSLRNLSSLSILLILMFIITSSDLKDLNDSGSVLVPVYATSSSGHFASSGLQRASAHVERVEMRLEAGSYQNYLYSIRNTCIMVYYFILSVMIFVLSILYIAGRTKISSRVMKLLSVLLFFGTAFYFIDTAVLMPRVLSGVQLTDLYLRVSEVSERNFHIYIILYGAANVVWKVSQRVAKMNLTYPSSQTT